jgi:hypothetical protein
MSLLHTGMLQGHWLVGSLPVHVGMGRFEVGCVSEDEICMFQDPR